MAPDPDVPQRQAHLGRDRVKDQRKDADVSQFRVGSSNLCGKQPPPKPWQHPFGGSGLDPDQTFIKQPHKLWSPEEQYQTDQMLIASICSSSQNSGSIPLSPQTLHFCFPASAENGLSCYPRAQVQGQDHEVHAGALGYRDGRQVKAGTVGVQRGSFSG